MPAVVVPNVTGNVTVFGIGASKLPYDYSTQPLTVAMDPRIHVPPADLTAPHFWGHTEGDLFWYISHGIDAPSGAPAMPAFGWPVVVRAASTTPATPASPPHKA